VDAETCHELAWNYLRSGQTDLALEHARRAHELSRGNVAYLNTLGVAYGESGELALAEATFRKALKRKPGFIDALVNLAKSLEKQERLDEAGQSYERALAIEPAFPKLATNLAKVYSQRGEVARARGLLEKQARTIDPHDFAIAMAQCELDAGESERALSRLAKAVAEHDDWKLARSALAHALLSTGRWREGWKEYVRRRNLFDARPTELPPPLAPRLLRARRGRDPGRRRVGHPPLDDQGQGLDRRRAGRGRCRAGRRSTEIAGVETDPNRQHDARRPGNDLETR